MRIVSICCFIMLVIFQGCDSKGKRVNDSTSTKFDLQHTRSDLKWDFNRNLTAELSEVVTWDYPSRIEMLKATKGGLVGVSIPEWQIIRLDKNLSRHKKFGQGGNGSLEENMNFYAYDILEYGYAIADNYGGWLKLYNWKRDSLTSYFPLDYHISTFTMLNDSVMFSLLENETGALEFNKKDVKNDQELSRINLSTISGMEMESDYEYMVFDGWMLKGENYIVMYFVMAGQLWVFDRTGQFSHKINTIDKTPFPEGIEISQPDGGTIYSTIPEDIFFLSAGIANNNVYLLNTISEKHTRCIDVYSIPTGKYLYSIVLNELKDSQLPIDLAVIDKEIFVLYEEMTIKKYEIRL